MVGVAVLDGLLGTRMEDNLPNITESIVGTDLFCVRPTSSFPLVPAPYRNGI